MLANQETSNKYIMQIVQSKSGMARIPSQHHGQDGYTRGYHLHTQHKDYRQAQR